MSERMEWRFKSFVVITFLFLCMLLLTCGGSVNSHDVSGSVKNSVTKAPVPNIRIILAPQVDEGASCVFDTALSAITNESGEFSIKGVQTGKYFIFFGSANQSLDSLNDAKIPTSTSKLMIAHKFQADSKLKDPVQALEGGRIMVKDGQLAVHGFLYVQSLNLLVFSKEGQLQYVDIAANTKGLVYDFKPGFIK